MLQFFLYYNLKTETFTGKIKQVRSQLPGHVGVEAFPLTPTIGPAQNILFFFYITISLYIVAQLTFIPQFFNVLSLKISNAQTYRARVSPCNKGKAPTIATLSTGNIHALSRHTPSKFKRYPCSPRPAIKMINF